jgi:hypothetical protein
MSTPVRLLICANSFLVALVGLPMVAAAGPAELTGTVRVVDGAPLFDASVFVEGMGTSTRTDSEGRYHIRHLVSGQVATVKILSKGFAPQKRTITLEDGVNTVDVVMQLPSLSETISVEAELPTLNTSGKVSGLTISPVQIAVLPSLGEKDIFRALQLLPGIASRESSSGLFVRGGTPSQNLVSYDGFTVYHVDHLFGYFSAFNMEAIDQVTLTKGSFDAKDGGRLGGVLDLTGKTGRRDRFGASGGISLLSAHGLAEVPLGNKASLLVAARHSFQGPLYDSILGLVGNNNGPAAGPGGFGGPPTAGRFGGRFAQFQTEPSSYFYDGNAKFLYEPSSRDKVSVSAYAGRDFIDNSRSLQLPEMLRTRLAALGREVPDNLELRDERTWMNRGLGASWQHVWGKDIHSRLLVGESQFDDENDRAMGAGSSGAGNAEDNDVDDLTARFEWHVPLRWNHAIDFGASTTSNHIRYDFATNSDTRAIGGTGARPTINAQLNRDESATQTSLYLQERSTLFKRVTVSPGLRATRYSRTGESYIEPRLTASALLTNQLTLKGAWGLQHQFANRVTREDVASGNRAFWTLSDGEQIPVARSRHAAAGFSFDTRGFLVDVEVFEKELEGLSQLVPRLIPVLQVATDLSSSFHTGEGTARGLEFLLQKKVGRHTGWVGYTYGRVLHTFATLQPDSFPAGHDQTHELKVVDTARFGRWTVSGTWIYATGQPYTAPSGVETTELGNGFAFDRLVLGSRNGARLPHYHRLDLAVNHDFQVGERVKLRVGASLFNVYDRSNVWYKEFQVVQGDVLENDILLMGRTLNAFANVVF